VLPSGIIKNDSYNVATQSIFICDKTQDNKAGLRKDRSDARGGGALLNYLIPTLKLKSNGPLYSNMVNCTLAVDEWAVTFGTARRGLGRLGPRPVPSSLYQM